MEGTKLKPRALFFLVMIRTSVQFADAMLANVATLFVRVLATGNGQATPWTKAKHHGWLSMLNILLRLTDKIQQRCYMPAVPTSPKCLGSLTLARSKMSVLPLNFLCLALLHITVVST